MEDEVEIVLVIEKIYFASSEERPQNVGIGQKKWDDADKMAKCYILASMSNALKQHHYKMVHAAVIIRNLTKMLDEKWRAGRVSALYIMINAKMSEGSPVGEHVMKMVGYIGALEDLGHGMIAESKVETILTSLSSSFYQFELIYCMNKLEITLPEPFNKLIMVEDLIRKDSGYSHLAKASSKLYFKRKGNWGQGQIINLRSNHNLHYTRRRRLPLL